jgi:hypothetical protein
MGICWISVKRFISGVDGVFKRIVGSGGCTEGMGTPFPPYCNIEGIFYILAFSCPDQSFSNSSSHATLIFL